jgi:hypothetical protein
MLRCQTKTLALREDQKLKLSENKGPRKLSTAKMDEVTDTSGYYIMRNFMIHARYLQLSRQ